MTEMIAEFQDGRDALIRQLQAYRPVNEQEACDCSEILRLLKTVPDLFQRTNLTCHMTASAWIVNREHTRVLMAYHNIYHSWSWLGGHADGETDLLRVAVREAQEESGIRNIRPVDGGIFSVEILTVDGHEKRGAYVPSHLHLNITYLLEADDTEQTHMKPDENSAVDWFTPEGAVEASTEPWFQERIYKKLNHRLQKLESGT